MRTPIGFVFATVMSLTASCTATPNVTQPAAQPLPGDAAASVSQDNAETSMLASFEDAGNQSSWPASNSAAQNLDALPVLPMPREPDAFQDDKDAVKKVSKFVPSSRPLFGASDGPELIDVKQGQIGDCYFEAGILTVVNRDPNYLKKNLRILGKTAANILVYSVRIAHRDPQRSGRMAMYNVPVAATFLKDGNNNSVSNDGSAYWAALYEKAFATLNNIYHLVGEQTDKGYQSISQGGYSEGLESISGQPLYGTAFFNYRIDNTRKPLDNPQISELIRQVDRGESLVTVEFPEGSDLRQVAQKYNLPQSGSGYRLPSGRTLMRSSNDEKSNLVVANPDGTKTNLHGAHVYAVLGTKGAQAGMVKVRNPWGDDKGDLGSGGFELDIRDLAVVATESNVVKVPASGL